MSHNWQYCWVRRKLLWTEQFWLPRVSFIMWGENKNFVIIYCVYTNMRYWLLQFSTCRKIPMQKIQKFVCHYKVREPPPSSFFRLWIRKKFLSYIPCPSYSLLYTGGNTQDGMERTQDKNKSHQKFWKLGL